MKPSDILRQAAQSGKYQQIRCVTSTGVDEDGHIRACAGTIIALETGLDYSVLREGLPDGVGTGFFPVVSHFHDHFENGAELISDIIRMNDTDGLTYEQIADELAASGA